MKTKLVNRRVKNTSLLTLIGVIVGFIMGGCVKEDPKPVLTPSLSYADTTLYKSGAEISLSPIVKDLPSGVKTYSFTTPPLDSGITLNASTGIITIGSNVAAGKYTLKVTLNVAGHSDAILSGNISVEILEEATIDTPTISYIANTTLYNEDKTLAPTVANLPDGDKTYSLTTTPSDVEGIEINASTGVISIASTVAAGEYTLKVTLNITGHSDAILSENISVTILDEATITYDANIGVYFGKTKTLEPNKFGLPNGDETYSFTTTPSDAGIEINTSTGVITIGSTVAVGEYTLEVTLSVAGNDDAFISGEITVTILALPTITYDANTTVNFGVIETIAPVVANLPNGDKTYSFTTTPSDAGIEINTSTGVITIGSSVPSGDYTLEVTLNVTGYDDAISSGNISVEILETPATPTPTITYDANTTVYVGNITTLAPVVADLPDGDKTYSFTTTPSDAGIEINTSTGNITIGSNVAVGEYTLKVTLNVVGHSDAILSENITVTILALPTITYDANTTVNFGVIKTLTPVVANLPNGDKTYSFTTTPSDAGIEINTSTGVITIGDAVELGDYTLEIALNVTGYDDAISSGDITVKIVSPDREAIMAFYNGITSGKDTLLNWGSEEPISEWSGITLNGENKRVINLNLIKRDFSGTLSPKLGDLTELESLTLQNNNFTGEIPIEFGKLTKLKTLNVANSGLTGGIPAELGNCSELIGLLFSNNNLTGGIPAELGNCTKLEKIYFPDNDLSGTLDMNLNSLVNLTHVVIRNNLGLTGPSPTSFCNASTIYTKTTTGLANCP